MCTFSQRPDAVAEVQFGELYECSVRLINERLIDVTCLLLI